MRGGWGAGCSVGEMRGGGLFWLLTGGGASTEGIPPADPGGGRGCGGGSGWNIGRGGPAMN